jgi:hypothetical protein
MKPIFGFSCGHESLAALATLKNMRVCSDETLAAIKLSFSPTVEEGQQGFWKLPESLIAMKNGQTAL